METVNKPIIASQNIICWNPAFEIEVLEKDGVFLFSEKKRVFLKGSAYRLLAPLISQNTYSADHMADQLREKIEPVLTYYALNNLDKEKFIQKKDAIFSDAFAAYCGHYGLTEGEVIEKLSCKKVYLANLAGVELERFVELFQAVHIQMTSQQEEASLLVTIVQDYLQTEIALIEEMAQRMQIPWLLVKPFGLTLWLGPLFEFPHIDCWRCLVSRLKGNRVEELYLAEKRRADRQWKNLSSLPCTLHVAYSLTVTEVFKYLALGQHERLKDHLLTFDTMESASQYHFFKCRHQTVTDLEQSKGLLLRSRKKIENSGGFRALSSEETLKKFEKLVSPITGVVTRLTLLDFKEEDAIYVSYGGTNQALPSVNLFSTKGFRSSSSGKGTSAAEAKVSCLCEAIERFSGTYDGTEERITAPYAEIRDLAIHPDQVLGFSLQQYQSAQESNLRAHSFNRIFDPFPEHIPLEWSPIWSLSEEKYKYYPTCCCYYYYPQASKIWNGTADSNGCAAGNYLEEALLQAFFELVERDCVAIWWYNRLNRPALDLQSFTHPFIKKMLQTYSQMGRELWVLDLTNDLNIPCFSALSRTKQGAQENIIMGFGAHLSMEVALIRAITEMNQMLGVLQQKKGSEQTTHRDQKIEEEWLRTATILNQPYLQGHGMKKRSDFPVWESDDLLHDIRHCQKIVGNLGLEWLVLNQTRPETGLPVVRVMVPGLRHFWQRLGPGRLYEVPVKMGWLQAPLKEEELNPMGMFL